MPNDESLKPKKIEWKGAHSPEETTRLNKETLEGAIGGPHMMATLRLKARTITEDADAVISEEVRAQVAGMSDRALVEHLQSAPLYEPDPSKYALNVAVAHVFLARTPDEA